MDFIKKNIWLILFVLWGLPLSYYRSKFRKIVYQTDSWLINIKPYFIKEIKGLFGTLYPKNQAYIKFRNFYLFYLLVYLLLFLVYVFFDKIVILPDIGTQLFLDFETREVNSVGVHPFRDKNFPFFT